MIYSNRATKLRLEKLPHSGEMLRSYVAALCLGPKSPTPNRNLAAMPINWGPYLSENNRPDDAIRLMEFAHQIAPEDESIENNRRIVWPRPDGMGDRRFIALHIVLTGQESNYVMTLPWPSVSLAVDWKAFRRRFDTTLPQETPIESNIICQHLGAVGVQIYFEEVQTRGSPQHHSNIGGEKPARECSTTTVQLPSAPASLRSGYYASTFRKQRLLTKQGARP